MITPSDDQISDLCAEACGYTINRGVVDCDGSLMPWRIWKKDGQDYNPKSFCTDRNLLRELWQKVESFGTRSEFLNWLYKLLDLDWGGSFNTWYIMRSSPRIQSIAALKALSRWPESWSVEDENA